MADKLLLTDRDVENIYGIPRSTQANGRMRGDFCPHIKRGRSIFYKRDDLDSWINSLRRRSTSDQGQTASAS